VEELHSHCNPRSQLDEKIKRNEPFHEKNCNSIAHRAPLCAHDTYTA